MVDETRVLSKGLAYTLAALTIFFAVGETALLIASGGVGPPHNNPFAYAFVNLSGFVLPILMVLATRKHAFKLPAIVWFHLDMTVLLLWFSEIVSPFTATWSLLTLFASIYYGWKGFIGSSVNMLLIVVAYCLLFTSELKPNPAVYAGIGLMVAVMTILNSYLFFRIIIAEKRRANQLGALLNSIREPVLTIDGTGKITSQNVAAQAFFDAKESFKGRNIDEILEFRDKSSDNHIVKVSQLVTEMPAQISVREDLIRENGEEIQYISLQLARIARTSDQPDEGGIVIVIRDITKQKTLEQEKDEFISVTSHELRTPVAIIEGSIGNISLLHSRNVNDGNIDKAIQMAREQIVNLSRIVNDISVIARAEKGYGEHKEEVNVDQLMSELRNRFEEEAGEKSLSFTIEANELPPIVTSREWLRDILENFVKNAIMYTSQGGIKIKADVQEDGRIYFEVADSGIGISSADQPRIFDKFYRVDDYHTRESSGTGLGLYQAKLLATKLDAEIKLASELDKGSSFRLVLPADVIKQPQPNLSKPQDTAQRS